MNTTHPYYIVAPEYSRFSGGCKVLHLLAQKISERANPAYLITASTIPEFEHLLLTKQIVQSHEENKIRPIVIYPEIVSGNPLNATCVVRYILNYPGKLGGPKTFGKEDSLVWFSSNMRDTRGSNDLVLCLPSIDLDNFKFEGNPTFRKGACFYAHKYTTNHGGELLPITANAECIHGAGHPEAQTPEEIRRIFQRCEVFYTYEATGLSIEAGLCGCRTVYIPNQFFGRHDLILPDGIGMAGAAWLDDEESIEASKKTILEVPSRYSQWVNLFDDQLTRFIENTQFSATQESAGWSIDFMNPFDSGLDVRITKEILFDKLSDANTQIQALHTDCSTLAKKLESAKIKIEALRLELHESIRFKKRVLEDFRVDVDDGLLIFLFGLGRFLRKAGKLLGISNQKTKT